MRLPVTVRAAGAAIAAGLVLVLAACGGDDGGPSKEEYIAAADRVCAEARAEAAPLLDRLAAADPTSLAGPGARRLAVDAERLATIADGLVADLRALEQPSGDSEAIDAFIGSTATLAEGIGRAADALDTGDVPSVLSALATVGSTGREVREAAEAYGFERCGDVVALPG